MYYEMIKTKYTHSDVLGFWRRIAYAFVSIKSRQFAVFHAKTKTHLNESFLFAVIQIHGLAIAYTIHRFVYRTVCHTYESALWSEVKSYDLICYFFSPFFFDDSFSRHRVSFTAINYRMLCLASSFVSGFFFSRVVTSVISFFFLAHCFKRTRDFRIPLEHLVCRLCLRVCKMWDFTYLCCCMAMCFMWDVHSTSHRFCFLVHKFPFLCQKNFDKKR